jgi:WD40 repeat protein
MMYVIRKKTAFLIGVTIVILAACTPSRSTEATATVTATGTPLPPPQAVDLGTLGKGAVSDAAWSPDGNLLAVRSLTGIHFHNTQTWEVVKTIPDSELEDRSLGYFAFSPDGKYLVFIAWGWNTPGAFWRYDLQSGEFALWLEGEGFNFSSAPIFSPDGKSFSILNDACEDTGAGEKICAYALELRDSADGKLLYRLQKDMSAQDDIGAFIFSPNGKQIAAASKDNFTRVWDTANGKLLYKFQHDSDVLDVAYSPDSRVLASASNDATVRFWDTQNGKNLFILRDFKQGVQRVVYLDQEKKLLVGEAFTNYFQEYDLDDQFLPINPSSIEMMVGERRESYLRMESTFTAETFVSPDERKMAVLLNNTIQIWNLSIGKPILTLPEYHSVISTWAFSPDSDILAVADHNIHLWDVPAKKWLAMLPIDAYEIQDTKFSPDGRQLVVSADGNLTFWDTSTFQKLHEVKTEHGIDILAYAPDGKRLAIAVYEHVQILDAKTGSVQQEFTIKNDGRPLALNFSADGKYLYYASSAGRLGWDLDADKILYSIQNAPDYYGKATITPRLGLVWQWDANYRYLDPASNPQWNNSFHFFDPATGQSLYDFANPSDSQYIAADLSADGRLLAWHRNEKIDLLDAASGQLLAAVDFRDANDLSLSPDAQILAVQSYLNPIHLWDVSSVAQHADDSTPLTATPASSFFTAPSATPTVPPLPIESLSPSKAGVGAIRPENIARLEMLNELGLGRIHTVSWSPDGKRFALGGYPSVYIFDLNSSKPLVTLPVQGEVMKLAYSPDGKMLAGQISDAVIEVWDIAAGQSLYKTDDIFCWNADIHFSTDGQVLSAQCGWTTYRWNARDGTLIDKKEDKNQPYGITSLDGNLLYKGGGTTARIVDAKTQKIIRTIEVPEMTSKLATFSPNGKTLLIWFYEYEIAPSGVFVPGKDFKSLIQLWNVEPGQSPTLRTTLPTGEWHHWEGDIGYQALSFTADSQRLATSSGDGSIQVWSVQSGKLLYTLPDGGEVSFSPNGNQLISIGDTVKIWDVTSGKQPVEVWNVSGLYEFQNLLGLTGNELVTIDDGMFRFRSMNGDVIAEQPLIIKAPDEDMANSAISPDGNWLAYRTATKLMLGRKVSQNVNWQTLEEFSDKPFDWDNRGMSFSPDGSLLAFIDTDRRILLWGVDDLESEPIELAREIYVTELIFSPDSKLLLGVSGSSEEQPLYLWDATTGKLLRTWKTKGYPFAFHPNGETLAFIEYQSGKIFLYDFGTWKLLLEMQGQKYAREIAFNPDGSLLVTSDEKGINFWDASTGELLKTIEGSIPWQLTFSPDGNLLVVTVGDGRVQVWGIR